MFPQFSNESLYLANVIAVMKPKGIYENERWRVWLAG